MGGVRRFVLAPLLAAAAALLLALALLSFAKGFDKDATAFLYGAGLLALAAIAGAFATALFTRWLPPARARWRWRVAAAAVALASVPAAALSGWFAVWAFSLLPEGLPYGVVFGLGAAGLTVFGALLARSAVGAWAAGPRPWSQSLAAIGVLVTTGVFAALVLETAIRGDYP